MRRGAERTAEDAQWADERLDKRGVGESGYP